MISLTHQFLAWCRSKPADEEFVYGDIYNCAFAQFLKESGICADPRVGGTYWSDRSIKNAPNHELPKKLCVALLTPPFAFGSLAERVERQLVEQVRL